MPPLRDVSTARPRILLIGINPSLKSEAVGHHFAGPGNPFWRLMYAAKLVPVALTHEQDYRLAEFGIALTNVCPRATRSASELGRDELDRGIAELRRKIPRMHPHVVAFVGVSIYRRFFGTGATGGAGPKPETINGARVFALPNPSGLNASFPGFNDKLVWFERLRQFAADSAPERSDQRGRKSRRA